ncbi:MAG: hypothetical protein JWQ39_1656 [Glaciihabitans sp.]|jgi:hypothetical protein|nr:hypothetical protein [Glaciihabitans sp.]
MQASRPPARQARKTSTGMLESANQPFLMHSMRVRYIASKST